MSRIGIIGAGIGGLTAAIKLGRAGHDVCIFESRGEDDLSHPWMDDIRFDVFASCGIEPPPRETYFNKGKRLFISPDCKNSFHVPFSPPMVEISLERPAFARHLVSLARQAGARLIFGCGVEGLIVENGAVCGFFAGGEEMRFDLIIDSSGLRSPFRAQVPGRFGIEAQPDDSGVMFAWRGFFRHKEGTPPPETDRNIYIRHLGSNGLSWCNLNQKDEVDVFVGRTGGLDEKEKDEAVADLFERHAFFSDEVLQEGVFAELPLRAPLSRMAADGYAAIGDAAYMTMPMMGSGIEASMKAASLLCEIIEKYDLRHFTARNLWEYQTGYYKELGAGYAFVDVVRRLLLGIDVEKLNWLFGCGAVTDEDMGMVSTESLKSFALSPLEAAGRARTLFKRPDVIAEAAGWMKKAAELKLAAKSIPEDYDEERIAAWQKKYDGMIKNL